MNTQEELKANVKGIVDDLRAISAGNLYEDECGNFTSEKLDGEGNEREPVSVYDYIEARSLSIENWKIDRDGECVGGKILFCYGGPTVWADENGVYGAWGTDREEWTDRTAGGLILDFLSETMPNR